MDPLWLALPGLLIWSAILLLPWRPWSTRESLDVNPGIDRDLSSVTVLIPARNEREVIGTTLTALTRQGDGLRVILIDDQSTDGTAEAAAASGLDHLEIIRGGSLEAGWSGKLWALQQGLGRVTTDYILLLDADIELAPGMIATLLDKLSAQNLQLVSLMARLRMASPWEKILMPAFIFFFKLLYPFRISNSSSGLIAAAAGGCILVSRQALLDIGGFASIRHELIDDCSLARHMKRRGFRTWIGLTHSAASHRHYERFAAIREMVSRTAFTQLHYSILLLLICTVLMVSAFVLPVAVLVTCQAFVLPAACLVLMAICYFPTLYFYGLSLFWAATLPLAGLLYLLMTWDSALKHWRGTGASWKDRSYSRQIH